MPSIVRKYCIGKNRTVPVVHFEFAIGFETEGKSSHPGLCTGGKNAFTGCRGLQPEGIGSFVAARYSLVTEGLGPIVRTVETESIAEFAKRPSWSVG